MSTIDPLLIVVMFILASFLIFLVEVVSFFMKKTTIVPNHCLILKSLLYVAFFTRNTFTVVISSIAKMIILGSECNKLIFKDMLKPFHAICAAHFSKKFRSNKKKSEIFTLRLQERSFLCPAFDIL